MKTKQNKSLMIQSRCGALDHQSQTPGIAEIRPSARGEAASQLGIIEPSLSAAASEDHET